MMSILTMRGPEFLALFAVVCLVVYMLVNWAIAASEDRPSHPPKIRDPYLIACLRGGEEALVYVAMLSLAVRGLLKTDATRLATVDSSEIDRVELPIEKVVLGACRLPSTPLGILADARVKSVAHEYRSNLLNAGLLADAAVVRVKLYVVLAGIALVVILACAKVEVALATGHSNIGFLVLTAGIATVALAWQLGRVRMTRLGAAALTDLAALFQSLKLRRHAWSGFGLSEAALLAAVFGIYIFPGLDEAVWRKIFPQPLVSASGSTYSGSSCGSGCGGGGGGGCGGGGCGGCGS